MVYIFLAAAGFCAGYFALRFFSLRRSIRQADAELKKINRQIGENQILKLAAPDKDLEGLLLTVNEMLRAIRREHIRYEKEEKEFQRQIENVSHDLRTPLTAILGYLEIMDAGSMSEEDRESLEVIKRKSRFLQRLVSQFYDLSRYSGEAYEPKLERLEVGQFLKETVLGQYQELTARNLEVEIRVPKGACYAAADKDGLERICSNLLQNVCRYGVSTLWIELVQTEHNVEITFANDVEDFRSEEAEKLFERFYTGSSARSGGSTGLGLTIAKCLAEKMGGSLDARFEEGEDRDWLKLRVILKS